MQTLPQETQFQSNYPITINAAKFNQFLDLCKNLDDTWSLIIGMYFSKTKQGLFAVCSTRWGTIRVKLSDQFFDFSNTSFFIKHFPKLSEDFSFFWDSKNLIVDCKAGKVNVPLIENDFFNYGHIEEHSGYDPKPIPTLALLESLPAMLKIITKDSIRNYGSILHIDATSENVRFVGSDGFRLAYYDFAVSNQETLDNLNLTHSACQFLAKLAKISKKEKQEIKVNCSEDKTTLYVSCGDIVASWRTSSVKFPQYKAVIPNRHGYTMAIIRDVKSKVSELKPLLKLAGKHKVARFIGETNESIENKIEVFGEQNPVGAINFNHASRSEIRFNAKFFLDCLSTLPCDSFSLYTKNNDEPIILESGRLTFLIVPVLHADEK